MGSTQSTWGGLLMQRINEEISYSTVKEFLRMIDESEEIQKCFQYDPCHRFTDRYLIATTLVYFERLRLQRTEFSPINFFLLLFLANDMEEDLDFKHELLPFALGKHWRDTFGHFQKAKEILWARMNYSPCFSFNPRSSHGLDKSP